MVVWVVPALNAVVGEPLERTGGVVSGVASVVKLLWFETVGPLPDPSVDPTMK